jgi:hypothetical protein
VRPAERRHFVVIGAMKCATTSIHRALASHPSVAVPRRKELDVFSDPAAPDDPERLRAAYERRFRGCDAPVVGEASPSYAMAPLVPGVPARMAAAVPDARLVYCVRDPIERMRSQYRHEVLRSRERRPADRALGDAAYLVPSLYGTQLEGYLEHFPGEQVAVVSTAHLRADPGAVLGPLLTFLGLDPTPVLEAQVTYASDERPALGSFTHRLRSLPGARSALALVPSDAKERLASVLPGAGRAAAEARALFATAPAWSPDPAQVDELGRDAARFVAALGRCTTIGDPDGVVAGTAR